MIDRIKVRLFLGILFSCFFSMLMAQNGHLEKGDSLFANQKYTEAFEEYTLLFDDGKASSAMLLKMAFIQDGLGNYADALFYLNKYYQSSADRTVIGKIEELAQSNDLDGYRYDDIDYFGALLSKYQTHITFLLGSIMLMLLAYTFKKSSKGEKPIAASIIQMVVIACLFGVINFKTSSMGIVSVNDALLRSGPSAGAEPIDFLNKGHKVKILSQNEIWTLIVWDGREVYIRNGNLRVI
ncbi:MAG: SH3 domain-containing protein [Ekhidna sp.]